MTATLAATAVEIRNILLATDFSHCSERALKYALSIAQRHSSKLYFFHAVPSALRGDEDANNAAWREAQSWDTHMRTHRELQGIEEEIIVREGDVWEEMAPVIQDKSIDLVIVGTHGRTGFNKLMLGSVAETIFRNALCPVLTVGPKVRRPQSLDDHRRVLVPIAFSEHSETVLPYAELIARQSHSGVTLLHVLPQAIEPSDLSDEQRRWTQSHLRDAARREGILTYGTELLVRRGTPVDTILKVSRQIRAELILMGIRAPFGLADHRMWPNAYMVVCGATCPVLTVRSTNVVN
jgi:nucleotide-binding universal stress UspA family protein